MRRCRLQTRKQPALTEYTFTREDITKTWFWIVGTSVLLGALITSRVSSAWPVQVSWIINSIITILVIVGIASITTASESLVVHGQLGLVFNRHNLLRQLTSSSFIDKDYIEGIIINEVLSNVSVHCYLTFMLVGQDNMAVAFQSLEPRLSQIIPIYQELMELGWGQ